MFKAVQFQLVAVMFVATGAALLAGFHGAVSALIGGFASIVPNFLFALRLKLASVRPGASYVVNFFVGEFLKVATTIGLLLVAVRMYKDMHWLSMLLSLVITLQASFFAFWNRSKNG